MVSYASIVPHDALCTMLDTMKVLNEHWTGNLCSLTIVPCQFIFFFKSLTDLVSNCKMIYINQRALCTSQKCVTGSFNKKGVRVMVVDLY